MKAKEVIRMFRKAQFLARHGDVVIVRTTGKVEATEDSEPILAHGEVTGHAHRVSPNDAKVRAVANSVAMKLVEVAKKAVVSHEEHKDVALPAGKYVSGIQQQWSPSGWTRVVD